MGIETAISWARSTFNSHWGCTKVSEACRDCYALAWAKRTGWDVWGPTKPRRFFGESHWNEPRKWERAAAAEQAAAAKAGKPPPPWRVFCSSMADVFEELPEGHPDIGAMDAARLKLWGLIEQTPHLTWMLLTKRPENLARLYPHIRPRPNVWLGTTVEDRESLSRLEHLCAVPAAVRFVSFEPLLEHLGAVDLRGISWAICGGESGGSARPFDLAWARDLRDQCAKAGVAFFMKQLGAKPQGLFADGETFVPHKAPNADPAFWPADLTMQEFPIARAA